MYAVGCGNLAYATAEARGAAKRFGRSWWSAWLAHEWQTFGIPYESDDKYLTLEAGMKSLYLIGTSLMCLESGSSGTQAHPHTWGGTKDADGKKHGYTYDALPTLTTSVPYETTLHFQRQREAWTARILAGATVLVTPGISKGELTMKNDCLSHGYPLIHLQAEPIGPYWKPEQSRFEACANGRLLILAPWHLDEKAPVNGIPSTSAYSRFHNLNTLAAQICAFDGEARIIGL